MQRHGLVFVPAYRPIDLDVRLLRQTFDFEHSGFEVVNDERVLARNLLAWAKLKVYMPLILSSVVRECAAVVADLRPPNDDA